MQNNSYVCIYIGGALPDWVVTEFRYLIQAAFLVLTHDCVYSQAAVSVMRRTEIRDTPRRHPERPTNFGQETY